MPSEKPLPLASYGPRATDYGPTIRAYAQLIRLPNVFSALADICLGWAGALAAGASASRWPIFLLLAAASACLYSAGMVWNDFFDLEQDRRERPFRPLPSGQISPSRAVRLGMVLLAVGVGFAALAGWRADGWQPTPVIVAGILVAAILLYDGWLKRTLAGPIAMGSCRFLNVLLGFTVADEASFPWNGRIYLAAVVGLYIAGVTWFARTEAQTSSKQALLAALLTMLAALILALAVPVAVGIGGSSVLFPYLLVILGFYLAFPALRAIENPKPTQVQAAVKRALQGLIILDAILASAVAGAWGLLLLLLLVPARFLGRWIYTT